MRLCWDDSTCATGEDNRSELKFIYNMGYRMTGIHSKPTATDDEIKRVKDEYGEIGMMIGPFWSIPAPFFVDPDLHKKNRTKLLALLKLAGKLGCPHIGGAVGSMHPKDHYRHHPDNHTQRAMDLLVKHTKELVHYAEDANCMICPETNSWTIVNSIERMREFIERVDSPYVRVCFDPVNHMNPQRVFDSGRWVKCAITYLGDCIGSIHCKDVQIMDNYMIHIEEAPMGNGVLDHLALIEMSSSLEPWKTFSLEHIDDPKRWKPAYDHIQGIASRIGHTWTNPTCSRDRWLDGKCK